MEGPHLERLVDIERARGALDVARERAQSGSNMDPAVLVRATAGALRSRGAEVSDDEIAALVTARASGADPGPHGAAALGYAELLKLVLLHSDEIPFIESQIKYFHSLALRHDRSAGAHLRRYRSPGGDGEARSRAAGAPPPEGVPAAMSALVLSARAALADARRHPLVVSAEFLGEFLRIRPFEDGNWRIALALADYLLLARGYDHIRLAPFEPAIADRSVALAAALRAGDAGRDAWVGHFLDAVAASQREALGAGAARARPRINARQERILAIVAERGAAKIGDILAVTGWPRATTKKDLRELADARLIVAAGVRKGTVYRVP